MAARPLHVETLNYRIGGFHPVHLNDEFKKGRYTVIHKLGHGGFATVWLARDRVQNRYVAIKILAARLSRDSPEIETLRRLRNSENHEGKAYVMSLLDHFWIDGPNGKHLCVVNEVAGTSIKQFNECPGFTSGTRRLRAGLARNVALQATQGLAFIHFTGIVHGDFTAANILLQIANIDKWTLEEIYERLGTPQTQDLDRFKDSKENTSGPRYTVDAISMKQVDPQWLSDQIMIIDFGISFLEKQSSTDFGTPKAYCGPEFNFDARRSMKSDVWALGCTIYEIRTGSYLFKYRGPPTRDQILASMVEMLGTLPNVWWANWEEGRKWYEIEMKKDGRLVGHPRGKLYQCIMDTGRHDGDSPSKASMHKNIDIKPNIHIKVASRSTSSPIRHESTNHLVALVEELTTSEAAEVLDLVYKPDSGSSGEKVNSGSSGEKASSGSSNNKRLSGSSSSQPKSTEKSVSSEGVSTGISHPQSATATLEPIADEEHNRPEEHETLVLSKATIDFLEPEGTEISVPESNDLEDLLRSALHFLPLERPDPLELSKHHWFHGKYGITS